MDRGQPVESTRPTIQGEGGVDSDEEKGTEREGAESVQASPSPEVVPNFGTGGDLVDTGEQMCHTTVAWHHTDGEERQEVLRRIGITRYIGGVKAGAKSLSRNQGQEGIVVEQLEVREDLAIGDADSPIITRQDLTFSPRLDPEERHLDLKKQEVELRRAKAEAQILEETLQEREKDLWSRLETVRQRLEVIRQRKALMDQEEEDIRQKLLEAGMEQAPAKSPRVLEQKEWL